MKFTCTQENLSQGLTTVSHLATKNTNLPILNNILLRAEKGVIELTTTNLEIGITKSIRGKIEEDGVFTVPAKVFNDYISLVKQEQVTLEQKGNDLLIQGEKSETKLRGLPAEDFPLIPTIERANEYSCHTNELQEAVAQVVFASAYDDARPEISGVLLQFSKKNLVLVATDSYRLAEKNIALQKGKDEEVSIIVPVRTLQELMRMTNQGSGETKIFITPNQILFHVDGAELVSRLIDGQYPDYKQIIPTSHGVEVVLQTKDFLQAVRTTSLFSRPGIHDLTITIQSKEQTMLLEAANSQVGENHQSVEAKIAGKDNQIIFNSRYLLDGLANLQSERVIFQMTNSASPGVLRAEGDTNYLYIIMPIKQ